MIPGQKRIIKLPAGVIIPPEDVKILADRTAETISEKPDLEDLVKKNFTDNPKFSFLKRNDPYRPYYEYKLKMIKMNKNEENSDQNNGDDAERMKEEDKRKTELKPPPKDKFFYNPGNVTKVENDLIKLTAQFVAKNGQMFLIALTEKEKKNPQFQFLKPTHQHFPYFTSLIDSYARIINFSREDEEEIMKRLADKQAVFNQCIDIFEYEHNQMQNQKKKEEIEEEERRQMALIDWNDFVVVQIIEFGEKVEDLPAPIDLSKNDYVPTLGFSKANINPEFSFLIDAYNIHKNLSTKDKQEKKRILKELEERERDKNRKNKNRYVDESNSNSKPPEFPKGLKTGQTSSLTSFEKTKELKLDIEVPDFYADFGSYSGRKMTVKANAGDTGEELFEKVVLLLGEYSRKYKLFDPLQQQITGLAKLYEYGLSSGELITLKKMKKLKI